MTAFTVVKFLFIVLLPTQNDEYLTVARLVPIIHEVVQHSSH